MSRLTYTDEEARKMWCPFTGKHCKGTECMLISYAGESYRQLTDPKKPLNEPKSKLQIVYTCGAKALPTIKVGDMEISGDFEDG